VKVTVARPEALSEADLDELFSLFRSAFQADRSGFESDLREKEQILRVHGEGGLQAFSTLKTLRPSKGVRLFFSGDTYAGPEVRMGHKLPSLWARFVYREVPKEEGVEDYWLLLCSGYRTYRILPTFFLRWAPGLEPDEELLRLRDRWAGHMFKERFRDGVVQPQWPTPLHQPEPPARLRNDPHVNFFLQSNPGYREGCELVCLVPLSAHNLRPAGRRLALASDIRG
jgi:hypothetical protein